MWKASKSSQPGRCSCTLSAASAVCCLCAAAPCVSCSLRCEDGPYRAMPESKPTGCMHWLLVCTMLTSRSVNTSPGSEKLDGVIR